MKVGSNSLIRTLNQSLGKSSDLLNRISSGSRLTKPSSDAAGQAIVAALEASGRTLQVASRNTYDGSSLIAIADGAQSSIGAIGERLSELAAQSANGTLSDTQRQALDQEFQQLKQEAQRIAESTQFNGTQVLKSGTTQIQVGTDSGANSQIAIQNGDLSSTLSSIADASIATADGARSAIDSVQNFIQSAASARGNLGAAEARLETAQQNIGVRRENELSAASRIRDEDIASATADLVKNNILGNANVAVLAQANQSAGQVLRLLQ